MFEKVNITVQSFSSFKNKNFQTLFSFWVYNVIQLTIIIDIIKEITKIKEDKKIAAFCAASFPFYIIPFPPFFCDNRHIIIKQ